MKVQTSLVSHPQKRCQAFCAQIAPAMRVKVHRIMPITLKRYESRSIFFGFGNTLSTRRISLVMLPLPFLTHLAWANRNAIDRAAAIKKNEVAKTATIT